ncbi:MAG: hypothetical protein U5K54_19540 [Cytophagales bacterium]|nr:hypothetical protein [Cytophagales bacterium]
MLSDDSCSQYYRLPSRVVSSLKNPIVLLMSKSPAPHQENAGWTQTPSRRLVVRDAFLDEVHMICEWKHHIVA